MKRLLGILLLGLAASSSSALTISRTDTKPTIDGVLDDACWQKAESADLKGHMGQAIQNRTTVRAVYDDSTLYVGFVCFERRMDKLVVAWDHPEERDNSLWNDDCVELFFDPFASGKHRFHIIVNPAGTMADNRDGNWLWNPNLTVATTKEKDFWTAEIAIPFNDLGYTPRGGEVWKGNLAREEKPDGDLSCLYPPMGAFDTVSKFGPLSFEPATGEQTFSLQQLFQGKLTGTLQNKQTTAEKFKVIIRTLEDLKPICEFTTKVMVQAGKTAPVSLTYKPDAKTTALDVEVVNLNSGKIVYRNQFELQSVTPKVQLRVWPIENPLYKELWSDEPMGLVREGAMFWAHGMDYNTMRPWACEYGKRYVYGEYWPILAEHKLWPILPALTYNNPNLNIPSYFEKLKMKAVLQADPRGSSAPNIDRDPLLLDPDVEKFYEAKTLQEIKEGGDKFWAVSYGDEIYEINETLIMKMFATMKDKYPYLQKLDEEVKQNFGGGKYGVPESTNDTNPYRWIAFRRWQNAKYNELFTRLYKKIKQEAPTIQVISPDPTAMHHPYDFSEWSKFSDIITHQLYPRCNENLATFGFHTKLVKDLSGMENVWPCLHVENYPATFTPWEALQLISEAFRNGATGFHYYLCDTIGRYAKKGYMIMEYFGAPDRWQVEMDVMKEVRQMNKLRFPAKADCAILYSCSSYAAQLPGTPSDEIEVAYTLLGPAAGSWFKFIDDYQIERGTINLSDYKVIYIPYAIYAEKTVAAKLADFVQNGGVLICGDPEVFSYDLLGEDLSSWRKKIFGVVPGENVNGGSLMWKGSKLAISSRIFKVKPLANTTVKARFANGDPAIIMHTFGKGKTYFFASNPFRLPSLSDAGWREYFKSLQKELGISVDNAIWRFQFPKSLIKPQPRPTGLCLTNNFIFWESCKPLSIANMDTKGTYLLNPAPDGVGDVESSSSISFDKGKLTNRGKAFTAGNVDLGTSKLEDWIVRYDKTEPFTLTFDFNQTYDNIEKVVLFYTGELPATKVEVSTDGKTWQLFAEQSALPVTQDVYDLVLSGTPKEARYVRLSFGLRSANNSFTLAECEVWAK